MERKPELKTKTASCPHGVALLDLCDQCLLESKNKSPYWEIITKLEDNQLLDTSAERNKPAYNFVIPSTLDPEGKFQKESFSIEQIRNPSDLRLVDVLNFLSTHFDPHVLNNVDGFKRKLTGHTSYNTERPAYRCFYVTNKNNEIIGVRVAEQIPIIQDGKIKKGGNIFYAMYIVMDPRYRGGNNIPLEMYTASLMDAAEMSYKKNDKVEYLIAECSSLTEKLQNRIGLKRVYLKREDGVVKEVEFFQPAMNFSPEDGTATSAESAEHFMLYKTNPTALTKEDVYLAISSLVLQYKSNHPRKYFEEKLALIKTQLETCTEVMQLAKHERGVDIVGFERADKEY